MDESILRLFAVTVGMFSIKSFGKGKGFLFGRTDLFKVMNAVVTQQAAVDGMDVSVSASSVGSVVDYVA